MTGSSFAENFYTITLRRILLRTASRARRSRSLARTGIPHELLKAWCSLAKFRRAPDPLCSCFTVANFHIHNECAKRRFVCIALLLLIRDLCSKLKRSRPDG